MLTLENNCYCSVFQVVLQCSAPGKYNIPRVQQKVLNRQLVDRKRQLNRLFNYLLEIFLSTLCEPVDIGKRSRNENFPKIVAMAAVL